MEIKELKKNFYNKISCLPPWLIPVFIVLIFRLFFYLTLDSYTINGDSMGYVNYPFEGLLNGEFNDGRTPVYPAIIRIFYYIFGEVKYLDFVVILQGIVSLISVVFFYKACNILVKNKIILFVTTLLYGFSSSIMGWNNSILTESFALSGTVVFIYYILKYIKTPKFSYGLINIILIFVLTFLRPTFLLFDVLLFVFWIFRMFFMKEERKILIKLSACSFAVFLFIAGYAYIFSKSYEIFSISDAVPRQHLYTVMERGYYKSSSSQEFIDSVEKSLEENRDNFWNAMIAVLSEFGNKEIARLNREAINNNIGLYIKDTISLAIETGPDVFLNIQKYREIPDGVNPLFFNSVKSVENIFSIFKVWHAYLIVIFEVIVAAILWIRKKSPPWVHIGIFVFVFSIVFTTYIGTCAEYDRTMVCVLPFMYLSLTIFINWLSNLVTKKQKLQEEDNLKIDIL